MLNQFSRTELLIGKEGIENYKMQKLQSLALEELDHL